MGFPSIKYLINIKYLVCFSRSRMSKRQLSENRDLRTYIKRLALNQEKTDASKNLICVWAGHIIIQFFHMALFLFLIVKKRLKTVLGNFVDIIDDRGIIDVPSPGFLEK